MTAVVAVDFALVVVVLVLLLTGLRVVRQHERLAVIRLGRYIGLKGPGLVFVLPAIDKAIRLNLDRDIPGWRSLSSESLEAEIVQRFPM